MKEIISYRKNNLSDQAQEYHNKIASAWHKTTQGILETAQTLLEAKQNLDRREWKQIKDRLEDNRIISSSVISKLLGIAENKVFSNPDYQQFLPPSYATLYMMKDEEESILIEKINNGDITAGLQQKEVSLIFPKESKETTKDITPKITISGDFSNITKEEHDKLVDVLQMLKSYGIKITGVELDES